MFENFSVTHGGNSYPFGTGHGEFYAKADGNTEKETFAEMLESVINNHESLELIEKYVPNAFKAFKEMIEEASK